MKPPRSLAQRLVRRCFSAESARRLSNLLRRAFDVDPVEDAYRSVGILNYEDADVSGEAYLVEAILPALIQGAEPVLFDVGANVGEVSRRLQQAFPRSRIYAFEPNPATFDVLKKNVDPLRVECICMGLGGERASRTLYAYAEDQTTGHATIYREALGLYADAYGIEKGRNVSAVAFEQVTGDAFCRERSIERVDFIKLDVEGHELDVLKGCEALLRKGGLGTIQFEITDCNVLSRVFLRDFYALLEGYAFFRLLPRGLCPLGGYQARHEIFQFQNILAVPRELEAPAAKFILAGE